MSTDEMSSRSSLSSRDGSGKGDATQSRWEGEDFPPRVPFLPTPVDPARQTFPFSIVWCPLPGITWFLPVVGHMGICDSRGVVYDFAGPFTIGVGELAFSRPYRFVQLDPSLVGKAPGVAPPVLPPASVASAAAAAAVAPLWDAALDAGCDAYERRMHNICADNCHHHVARCLNEMAYRGRRDWTQVGVGALLILHGTWVSPRAALAVWAPFLVVLAIALALALR